jgi:hypothetical protein
MQRFASASWPNALKVSSLLESVILVGVGIIAVKTIPYGTRNPFFQTFGPLVAFMPLAIALFAILFIVSGYELEPSRLRIRRLLWSTQIPLFGLHRIYADSIIMKHSIRVFGNGGFFSFTGLYQSRALGRYRAFVTDPKCSVALFLPTGVVVVSPADAELFVRSVRSQFPGIQVGPPIAAS